MKFSCDKCSAQYMISDDKVGPNGVRVRCKRCGNIVSVRRAPLVAPELEPAPDVPAPTELEPVGEQSAASETSGETSLERELGQAFDHAFGDAGSVPLPEAEPEPEPEAAFSPAPAPKPEPEQIEEPMATVIALPAPEKAAPGADVAPVEAIEDWYVAIDDNQVGPLQATLVKARWEAGEIGPDTLAWRPGMGDWMPISSIPEMAQYLAPVPRGAPAAAGALAAAAPEAEASVEEPAASALSVSAAAAAAAAPSAMNMNGAVSDGADEFFKPSAGSALAALASEEISSFARPEPRTVTAATAATASAGGALAGSLVDRMGLPDGGVDPTNIVPLPIKGLETTGESEIREIGSKPSTVARGARGGKAKSSRLVVLAAAGALVLLVAGGIAIALSWTRVQPAGEQGATASAARPAAERPQPLPDGDGAARVATTTPGSTAGAPAAAPVSQSAPAGSAPAPSQPAPPPAVARARAGEQAPAATPSEPPSTRAMTRRERAAKAAEARAAEAAARQAQRAQERVALAPPPPRAEPHAEPLAKRSSDPLLEVADEDVEAELAGKKRRSVYVPPAIGGDLPQNVSVSQINEAVRGQTSALQRCVEQQRAADPGTRGTLKVRWVIGSDGGVREVRVLSEEFGRQPIAPCITGVVRSLRFPRSRTTGQEVVFPFKF